MERMNFLQQQSIIMIFTKSANFMLQEKMFLSLKQLMSIFTQRHVCELIKELLNFYSYSAKITTLKVKILFVINQKESKSLILSILLLNKLEICYKL